MHNIYKLKKIETPRTIVKPIQLGDEYDINKSVNNSLSVLQKWQPWANDPSIEATTTFVREGVFAWESQLIINFPMSVTHKEDNKIIAATGFNENSNPDMGIYEIGYWCDIDYQGQGIVTEYVNALSKYALSVLRANELIIRVNIDNRKSIAVAKRLNYSLSKTIETPLESSTGTIKEHIYTLKDITLLPPIDSLWEEEKRSCDTKDIIDWAAGVLGKNNNINKGELIVQTPWSKVIKIISNSDIFFIKKTPPELYIESDIIELITGINPKALTPRLIAKSDKLSTFITTSAGNISLRDKFKGKLDQTLWLDGLISYTTIMRSMENRIEDFINKGVPNWKVENFPELLDNILKEKELLLSEGLSLSDIKALKALKLTISKLSNNLINCKIKQTLINADFNENNLVYDTNNKTVKVIDIGECIVSHPFLSIVAHLNATIRRYKLDANSSIITSTKNNWLSLWSDVANSNEINETYSITTKLFPLFAALSTYRLYKATDFKCLPMVSFKVSDCLRLLINQNNI